MAARQVTASYENDDGSYEAFFFADDEAADEFEERMQLLKTEWLALRSPLNSADAWRLLAWCRRFNEHRDIYTDAGIPQDIWNRKRIAGRWAREWIRHLERVREEDMRRGAAPAA